MEKDFSIKDSCKWQAERIGKRLNIKLRIEEVGDKSLWLVRDMENGEVDRYPFGDSFSCYMFEDYMFKFLRGLEAGIIYLQNGNGE